MEKPKRTIPTNVDSGEQGQKRKLESIQSEDDEERSQSSRNAKRTRNPEETEMELEIKKARSAGSAVDDQVKVPAIAFSPNIRS